MRILILLFSILLFFSACKKNKNRDITFQGVVTDLNTSDPSSGITIKFYYQEIGNSTFSSAYKLIGSTTTDANGNYSFSTEKLSAASYRYELSSARDFTSSYSENADNISSSEVNTRNFTIESKSWFSIRIHNGSPVGALDEIIYQNTGLSDCSSCCNNTAFVHTGMVLDTTFVCTKKGGKNINFTWSVTKATVTNNYNQSLYCAPYDTTYYYLNY